MNVIIQTIGKELSYFLTQILVSLFILVVGLRIITWVEKKISKENKFTKLDSTVRNFVISFISIALKILLIIIILSVLGVPMASIVTVVGSCAVAIGLALQGGLSNIAGGFMILIFKPFKEGNYISACDLEGTVRSITMFYTTINTTDNKVIQIPNGVLSNSSIVNYSANKTRRVDLKISVSYDTKIEKVKNILNEIIKNHPLVLQDEKIIIRLKEHSDSSLNFDVKVWTKTEDYWDVYYDLMEQIKEDFDKNKIEIPFPQMDVHITK